MKDYIQVESEKKTATVTYVSTLKDILQETLLTFITVLGFQKIKNMSKIIMNETKLRASISTKSAPCTHTQPILVLPP